MSTFSDVTLVFGDDKCSELVCADKCSILKPDINYRDGHHRDSLAGTVITGILITGTVIL